MKRGIAILSAAMLVAMTGMTEAKTLKVQASSKAGDWAHRFMTDTWAPKLGEMTAGSVMIEVLPTKAVVPHRETIDAVANGILDGDLNAVSYFSMSSVAAPMPRRPSSRPFRSTRSPT